MNRSKLSLKAILLAGGVGLAAAAAVGLPQPAAAQSYDSCPAGDVYNPSYGCTLSGSVYTPYDYGYYGYPYYGGYGSYAGRRGGFGHGIGHGMGDGFSHDLGGGFGHGVSFAHGGGVGGFGHGMAGGFGHGGGGGHR